MESKIVGDGAIGITKSSCQCSITMYYGGGWPVSAGVNH